MTIEGKTKIIETVADPNLVRIVTKDSLTANDAAIQADLPVAEDKTAQTCSVFHLLKNRNFLKKNTNLIYLDPPFKEDKILEIFKCLIQQYSFSSKTLIILHRNKTIKEKLPNNFNILDERIYGISKIIFGKLLT